MRCSMVLARIRAYRVLSDERNLTMHCVARFDNNFKLLRRKGTLVSVGNASGVVPPFSPLKLVEKNIKLLRPSCVLSSPS